MKSVTIPLAGTFTARGFNKTTGSSTKDQRFVNVIFDSSQNKITQNSKLYVLKVPAHSNGTTISSGAVIMALDHEHGNSFSSEIYHVTTGSFPSQRFYIYKGTTNLGEISGALNGHRLASGSVNGELAVFFTSAFEGWYLAEDAMSSLTFTGNTNSNTTINNISSTAGLYVGQAISGTGIQSGTRISSIDSSTSITITLAATSTASGVTITREAIAKVIDADFPSDASGVEYMDGYVLWSTNSGRIYQSGLNNPATIAANDYLTVPVLPSMVVVKDRLYVSSQSGEWRVFENAGNPSGSILNRILGSERVAEDGDLNDGCFLGDDFYYIGSSSAPDQSSGYTGFYKISAGGISKLSDTVVDLLIGASGAPRAYRIYLGGRAFVCIPLLSRSTNLLYDPLHDSFTEATVAGGVGINGTNGGRSFTVSTATGLVYSFQLAANADTYTGSVTSPTATIQTSKTDFGTENLKSVLSVSLMGSDIQSSGTATLEYSDDDYTTWTTAGTFDLTKINPKIHRCGSFRGGRAWRLTHSANTPFRAQALKFDYTEGRH